MVIEVVVGNDKVIEAAINDNKEVFSDFDDSKDADYKESKDDKSSDGSGSMADDNDKEEWIGTIWPRRARKRKIWPVFKDYRGIGIDSEDGLYKQLGTKQQRRMLEFVDSGVIMASSQDDGAVPLSSPPDVGWIILRESKDVEEGILEAETVVERAVKDKGKGTKSDDLFEP
ncbi:hypothetical protein B0J14DRAFT_571241 [Halenospora varia]|nr:hypothetical protein B0J14DRAFT_571241 [Halenospora varia]